MSEFLIQLIEDATTTDVPTSPKPKNKIKAVASPVQYYIEINRLWVHSSWQWMCSYLAYIYYIRII
jgi:hypothetical protein